MNTVNIIIALRKDKGWSQTDLSKRCGVSREMVGKYKRGEAVPSIEAAKKIADAFEISLDYLIEEGVNTHFDKKTLQRIQEPELREEDKKKTLFDLMDTNIPDAKAGRYRPVIIYK